METGADKNTSLKVYIPGICQGYITEKVRVYLELYLTSTNKRWMGHFSLTAKLKIFIVKMQNICNLIG